MYIITYKHHNPNITYYQNSNKNIATKIVVGLDEVKNFIAFLNSKNIEVASVRDGIGRKVAIV